MTAGLLLLSRLDVGHERRRLLALPARPRPRALARSMQVLVLAVQNAVDYANARLRHLGGDAGARDRRFDRDGGVRDDLLDRAPPPPARRADRARSDTRSRRVGG